MARQNSKYFSSVIEKLIADKHKENIVIDQAFKARLRQELLAGTAVMEKAGTAEEGESGFGAFLSRWKYALALVPSALLVMLVAAQVMNLPVKMGSDVVVPNVVDSKTTEKKIKTFPGATILEKTSGEGEAKVLSTEPAEAGNDEEPADSAGGLRVVSRGETPGTGSESGKTEPVESVAVLQSVVAGETDGALTVTTEKTSSATGTGNVTDVVTGTSGTQATSTAATRTRDTEVTDGFGQETESSLTDTQNTEVADSSQNRLPDTPYYSMFSFNTPDRTADTEEEDEEEITRAEENESDEETESAEDENKSSLDLVSKGDSLTLAGDGQGGGTVQPAVKATLDVVNPSLAVPSTSGAEARMFNVIYETSLNTSEKASLEGGMIESMTEGKDVKRVVVGRDENNYVKITVYYGDGSSTVKTCSYNSGRGVWDTVTYVAPVTTSTDLKYRSLRVSY